MQYYFPKEKLFRLLYFLFGVILVWNFYLYLLPFKNTIVHNLFAFSYAATFILAGVIAIFGIKILSLKNAVSRGLVFLTLATFTFAIGLLVQVYFHVFARVPLNFPSVADGFFLVFYPLVGIAMFFILKSLVTISSKTILLETMIIAAVSTITVNIAARADVSGQISNIGRLVNYGYLIGDMLLIAITYIFIRLSSRKTEPSVILIIISLLFQTAAHLMFMYRVANGLYWIGDISDLLSAASAFTFCLAIISIVDRIHRHANY